MSVYLGKKKVGVASKYTIITDIDLGITGASVGQVPSVGSVDQNGKPLTWDPVNNGTVTVTVTGITPSITAEANHLYVCGEVSTLDITLPASGIVDVTFESGTTPTVLTITPPTGVTLKWANDFDSTSLEASMTYELNIMNGIGVAVGVSA